jgi:hypothetical protein
MTNGGLSVATADRDGMWQIFPPNFEIHSPLVYKILWFSVPLSLTTKRQGVKAIHELVPYYSLNLYVKYAPHFYAVILVC